MEIRNTTGRRTTGEKDDLEGEKKKITKICRGNKKWLEYVLGWMQK